MNNEKITRCNDCGVKPGVPHKDGCDVARCMPTGGQRLQCELFGGCGEPDCRPDVWTGVWPGVMECEAWGWYSVLITGRGWVAVPEGTPGATADLNRLHRDATWDPKLGTWVRKQ